MKWNSEFISKPRTSCLPRTKRVWGMCGWNFGRVEPNLYEVSAAAVDVDVGQLQADDLTGLGDDESSAGQLWPRRHEGEVAIGGQHVQTPYEPHTHTHYWFIMTLEGFIKHLRTHLLTTSQWYSMLKEQITPKSCSVIYQYRFFFWCELAFFWRYQL